MLRVREIHRDAVQTVSVVETVESRRSRNGSCWHAWGKIEPLAVLVRHPDGEYAVDINARPIDVEHLSQMLKLQRVREKSLG